MATSSQIRQLYRRLLRELPSRSPSAPRSSIHHSIRSHLFSSTPASPEHALARTQELEQLVQYLKAQRMYGTLLERYNSSTGMEDEERVRLTARRVGMEMPIEFPKK